MKLKCPNCGIEGSIDDEMVDEKIDCNACHTTFIPSEHEAETDICIDPPVNPFRLFCRIAGVVVAFVSVYQIYEKCVIAKEDIVTGNNWHFLVFLGFSAFAVLFSFTEPVERYVHIICPNQNCNYVGDAKTTGGPNGCVFFILLLLAVVPALIYYLICGKQRTVICPKCGIRIR